MSYITYQDVETYLNVTLNGNGQAQVNAIIPSVEAFVENACNRTWNLSAPITETFDGGNNTLFPKNIPIDSVTSLTVDGTPLTADSDFYIYPSYIRLAFHSNPGYRTVVLTYDSAVTLPEDVKHAIVRWTAQIYKESKDAGKVVSRLQQGPVSLEYLAQDGVPKFVQEVISRHRLSAR